MQAIRVRYLGPTNTKGSRIKAMSADGKSVTVSKTYADDHSDEKRAVAALCKKLGWTGCDRMIRGGLSGDESVFVFLPGGCSCPDSAFRWAPGDRALMRIARSHARKLAKQVCGR